MRVVIGVTNGFFTQIAFILLIYIYITSIMWSNLSIFFCSGFSNILCLGISFPFQNHKIL